MLAIQAKKVTYKYKPKLPSPDLGEGPGVG
jgi:hypothetical protein